MSTQDQKKRVFLYDVRLRQWQSSFWRAKVLSVSMLILVITLLQFATFAQETHVVPSKFGAPVVATPLSATRTYDYEPAQGSTNPVAVHTEEKYFRDSAGRTRSESNNTGRRTTIDIIDFVAHLHYRWTVGYSMATREEFSEATPRTNASEILPTNAPTIEGVPTRYSHSVTGKDENEKSIESWYSPDLKLAMLTIIDRPGIGKKTYRFVKVSQAEPDAALFRVPEGFTIQNSNQTPPPPVPTNPSALSAEDPLAGKSSLPHEIDDDNYLEALARFHAAVPRSISSSDYHLRTDLRMIDMNGKESNANVDHWQRGQLARDEEKASGWHYITVWGKEQNWSTHEGTSPLRLYSFSDLTPRPGPMERRIRIYAQGYVAMKSQIIDGVNLSCSGKYAGAELCFDTSTGFPVSAALDGELIVYERWAQFNGATYPSRLALYRGHRLQMEATTTVTPLEEVSNDLFQPLPGVTPLSNRFGASRADKYRSLKWSQMDTGSNGEALVRAFVGESGRVVHAELLDADDKSLAKPAMAAAKKLVFMPQEINGHKASFETTFWTSHWSTVDPLRIPASSLKSQGTD
jgi:hypothetical protein